MLKTGEAHLESLRDGRVVFIGAERVDDVTTHPAFRNAARTIADIYDMKADPANHDLMSYQDDADPSGERFSRYFHRPTSREDLELRSLAHRKIAEMSHGLLGRSPDHVASFVAGMAMDSSVLEEGGSGYGANLLKYYEQMRREDLYACYAVIPPQAARNPEFYERKNMPIPTLRVVHEDDEGVVISGMKMLATGAAFANEIWIGNLIPLAPNQLAESITCAIPCNAPGVQLWSRKPFERDARNQFDSPLTWRFDESDCLVLCRSVRVPWERVFVHNDPVLAREIYIRTPSHCFGNHQSNVRFHVKLRLLLGIASRLAQTSGAIETPAVRETLGRMSSMEAGLGAMIDGQLQAYEQWPDDGVCFNRRYMYAALNWCTENHSMLIDLLRELMGGGVFQMPASVDVVLDDELRPEFEKFWQTPFVDALDRMKLFRLAWDLVGSEFAGRHQQYEKFYAGASFIVRNHSFRETPWEELDNVAEGAMAHYDVPAKRD